MAKNKQKRRLGIIGAILLLCNIVVSVLLLVSIFAGYFKPSQWPFSAFLAIIFPYLFILQIVFLLYFLFKRSKFVLIAILSIVISIPSCRRIWTINGESNNSKESIKIVSFNVKNLTIEKNSTKQLSIDDFYKHLEKLNADVINLQEYSLYNVQKDLNKLKKITNTKHVAYTNYFSNNPSLSIITLSKYPIINIESIRSEGKSYAIASDIVINNDTIKVVNVHLQSIYLNLDEINSIPNNTEEAKVISKRVYGKIVYAAQQREKQVQKIIANIGSNPNKTILCGDFNDTPNSYTYKQINNVMTDIFIKNGKGFGFTFKELPLLRIDYMFTSKDINPLSFQIDRKSDMSDHNIIIGEIEL
ncbi:endonuclease/exonuclease/phosphatase family protein [Bacteroidales bacterium OttesenSCG-928-K03]|nr:endonuclease/exonuclease/phosphatase family protein [Bacteroidales bacterium OttesenSCG-928-K03]